MAAETPSPADARTADRNSRHAALTLAATLPTDVVLYLLLPMYGAAFGVSLAEAGILLAANRLVRIVGYGQVTRLYARHGDRRSCEIAVAGTVVSAIGLGLFSGFWALLPLRLIWGLSYAALNLSTQAMATALPVGAAARSGRSRAFIAIGPVLALPVAALLSARVGPRWIFAVLALVAVGGLFSARRLPTDPHPHLHAPRADTKRIDPLDVWSFLEGFTLDGLFIIGLSYLGHQLLPGGAVFAAGATMALRYGAEIVLSPVGGRMAERWDASRLLLVLSVATSVVLFGFGVGWVWSCAALIVVLRALQLPLLAPIVSRRYAGRERLRALATRSVWRDIGAGFGPMTAGLLLPVISSAWMYGIAAALLSLAAIECARQPGLER